MASSRLKEGIISVVSGAGTGQTLLSAFDGALLAAGVHNYNLIYLSSIIPPGKQITTPEKFSTAPEEYGHRLYVVRAKAASDNKGDCIGTAVGWYQLEDGRGVFVEHEAVETGMSEQEIQQELTHNVTRSLEDLCQRRGFVFEKEKIGLRCKTAVVTDQSTCVLTLAVYQAEGWNTDI